MFTFRFKHLTWHLGGVLLAVAVLCGPARANDIVVTSGGTAQQQFSFRNAEHKMLDYTTKDYWKDFYLPLGARLVTAQPNYAQRQHVIPFPDGPQVKILYIKANGDITSDKTQAAGVRVGVRLESEPRFKIVGPFGHRVPVRNPFEGVLEGTLTLTYEGGEARVFVTSGGGRFVRGAGKSWTEYGPTGPRYHFQEISRPTPRTIELYDSQRRFYVQLTASQAFGRMSPSDPWRPWTGSEGRWTE